MTNLYMIQRKVKRFLLDNLGDVENLDKVSDEKLKKLEARLHQELKQSEGEGYSNDITNHFWNDFLMQMSHGLLDRTNPPEFEKDAGP